MGSVANALAAGTQYTYKDVTYTLSPCTYEVQGVFERYLESYAVDSYYRLARRLSAEDQEKGLAALHRDITAGRYTFGGTAVREALDSPVHLRQMIFLMLKKNHPEITQELVREMFEVDGAKLMLAVNTANADPNRQTSVTTTAPAQS